MSISKKLRDFIICLSLANLCFIMTFAEVTYINKDNSYLMKYPPTLFSFVAIIINVLVFALIFWSGITIARRSKNPIISIIAKSIFVIMIGIALYSVTKTFNSTLCKLLDLIYIISIIAMLRWSRQIIKTMTTVVILMVPLVIFTFGQTIWGAIDSITIKPAVPISTPTLQKTGINNTSTRVIWIIFDQLDEQMAFSKRPRTLLLPEFDRLSQQALLSTKAYPPARSTINSIPALFCGEKIIGAKVTSYNELLVTYENSNTSFNWATQPNVFSRAKKLGVNTALIGWYHPYSRIIGKDVTYSSWEPREYEVNDPNNKLWENIISQLFFFLPLSENKHQIHSYKSIHHESKKLVADSKYSLIVIHYPIPHRPYIYDQNKQKLTFWNYESRNNYIANIALADKTLGEIRHVLDTDNLWEDSTIIVTADHFFHNFEQLKLIPNHQIPFIIKLAHQNKGVVFNQPFNTVLTHDLVLSILQEKVTSTRGLVNWLEEHGKNQKDPSKFY